MHCVRKEHDANGEERATNGIKRELVLWRIGPAYDMLYT
jgi:hypothetical protein